MTYPKSPRYLFLALLFLTGCFAAQVNAQKLEGIASFYADKFNGKPTSTGEVYRHTGYSAASKDLPWGTIVEVTNIANGKTTQVRINDCGPHARGRLIDLSKAAAQDLDFIKNGEAKVKLRIIQASTAGPTCARGAWAKKLKAQGKAIPPPPPPWDPTQTVASTPVNPVVAGPPSVAPNNPVPEGSLRGMASYYPDRLQGRPTSTGEIYDGKLLTAASKDFPYGTRLEVMNIVSGQKVEVKVNDCGPNSPDRIVDLSRAAAEKIDLVKAGTAVVQIRVLSLGTEGPTCNRAAWKLQQAAAANAAVLSPAPAPTTTPAPAAAPSNADGLVEAYRVQVAAFGSPANADKQIAELKAKGFTDVYGEGDKDLIRIYAGMLSSEKAAEDLEKELRQKGYPKATLKETKVRPEALRDPVATYQQTQVVKPVPAQKEFDPTDILFGVQVGAYSAKAGADKVEKALQEKGFTEVYSAKVGKMYRVFSGKFYFQSQAEVEKEKLRAAGYGDATVRRVQ